MLSFPYDSTHQFRENSPEKWKDGDFFTKFHLDSNQDRRLAVALDQEEFFQQDPVVHPPGARFMQQMQQFNSRPVSTSIRSRLTFLVTHACSNMPLRTVAIWAPHLPHDQQTCEYGISPPDDPGPARTFARSAGGSSASIPRRSAYSHAFSDKLSIGIGIIVFFGEALMKWARPNLIRRILNENEDFLIWMAYPALLYTFKC